VRIAAERVVVRWRENRGDFVEAEPVWRVMPTNLHVGTSDLPAASCDRFHPSRQRSLCRRAAKSLADSVRVAFDSHPKRTASLIDQRRLAGVIIEETFASRPCENNCFDLQVAVCFQAAAMVPRMELPGEPSFMPGIAWL